MVTEQETVKAGLLEQLDKTNSELSNKVKDLADQLEKCQNIESQIEEGKDQLRELKELFNEIWERRMAAQDDVDRKRRRVNDLRR